MEIGERDTQPGNHVESSFIPLVGRVDNVPQLAHAAEVVLHQDSIGRNHLVSHQVIVVELASLRFPLGLNRTYSRLGSLVSLVDQNRPRSGELNSSLTRIFILQFERSLGQHLSVRLRTIQENREIGLGPWKMT